MRRRPSLAARASGRTRIAFSSFSWLVPVALDRSSIRECGYKNLERGEFRSSQCSPPCSSQLCCSNDTTTLGDGLLPANWSARTCAHRQSEHFQYTVRPEMSTPGCRLRDEPVLILIEAQKLSRALSAQHLLYPVCWPVLLLSTSLNSFSITSDRYSPA